jgi:hypothetical protein
MKALWMNQKIMVMSESAQELSNLVCQSGAAVRSMLEINISAGHL